MSLSEFRFNKKRRHYAYLFKAIGLYRKNIILTTKPVRVWRGKIKKNIKLFSHPNTNSSKEVYVIPIVYLDYVDCFHSDLLKWCFHKNDKRTIKRLKRKKRKSQ